MKFKRKQNKKVKKPSEKKTSEKKSSEKKFVLTSDMKDSIHKAAVSLVKKPNIKKYEFPVTATERMLKRLVVDSDGAYSLDKVVPFAAGYCTKTDIDYPQVNAIINLTEKYHPESIVVVKKSAGRKALIVGEVADELYRKMKIDWFEAHITTGGAKVPVKLSINSKMKCFNGEKISDEIKRQNKKNTK